MKVAKYDAVRDVFYDIEVNEIEAELKNYGVADEQIAPIVEENKQKVYGKVADIMGVTPEAIVEVDGIVTIDIAKSPEEQVVE